MHPISKLVLAGCAVLISSAAHAALIGTSVTGSLTFTGFAPNYFDPANGGVPTGFLNTAGTTVTVAEPQVEFGYKDAANQISVNLTDSQVLLEDQTLLGPSVNSFEVKLTDAAFAGMYPVVQADSFGTAPTASITGTTLTIDVPVNVQSANTLAVALYSLSTPEPASMASIAAIAGMGLVRRTRRRH